jgi:putative ABC transport system ATP-binding protein
LFSAIQKAGNTVILVTHEEDIAACAQRIVRLRDGRVDVDA